jgi:hypothetical protein
MWYLVKVGSSALFHREFASWPFSFKNTAKKNKRLCEGSKKPTVYSQN